MLPFIYAFGHVVVQYSLPCMDPATIGQLLCMDSFSMCQLVIIAIK